MTLAIGTPLDGRNPMRWDCARRGCFNLLRRPKIETFAECLPGRGAFSDIDAIAELGGRFLLIEWKAHAGPLPRGQELMLERLTSCGPISVIVICGDAETMAVQRAAVIHGGRNRGWQDAELDDVKRRIRAWAARASAGRAA